MHNRLGTFLVSLRVGLYLAWRDIKRSNIWTTILISVVMTLTFLNLIVVSGILVGLIQGSEDANKIAYTSDIIISAPKEKSYIQKTTAIVNVLQGLEGVEAITTRYLESGKIEADYKNRSRLSDVIDSAGGIIAGINPSDEDAVTQLSKYVVEGSYLAEGDFDEILIGSNLLSRYLAAESPGLQTVDNVFVGTKVRLSINGFDREVEVKGILKSKVGDIDQRLFMTDTQLRQLIGRYDYNADEIAVKLKPGVSPESIKDALIRSGFDSVATIQTWQDAQPKFLKDIKATFALLGNMISAIGLVVASITIFIVIFVNAITRRRFIGIMKGIGIHSTAIEVSYVVQSLIYAGVGMALGAAIVFGFLKPAIAANPIDFPFSDGILVATASGTLLRAGVLFLSTIVAGYIPARLVVKGNTLDAILGRK